MDRTDANPASSPVAAGHAPLDCFGERGMAHRAGRPHRAPIAAGLFGLPSAGAPLPSNDPAGGRMMFAA